MSIRIKLFLLFLLTVLVLTGLSIHAIVVYRNGLNGMQKLHESAHIATDAVNNLRLQLQLERTAWKNVLLRGGEPGKYHHYLSEFYSQEHTTRKQIQGLNDLLLADTEVEPLIEQLKESHLQLGRALREAIRVFNASEQNAHRFADQVVAKIESNPHQLIDKIKALVDRRERAKLMATEKLLDVEETFLSLSLVLFGGGALLLFFWVLDRNVGKPAEKAAFLANYDPLTALPNRTLFQDRLQHAISRVERNSGRVSLLFFDLDHFKAVNDALGHHMGDELLKQVGERLRKNLRDSDTPARLGGDEFAVIIENSCEEGSVAHVAQNIVNAIAAPYQIDDHRAHVSVSIGITRYPDDGHSVEKLLKNADAAMYQAKQKGRGSYHFFTEDLNQAAEQRLALESRLRHAVDTQGFELHYQPQISLADGSLIGAEVLLRFSYDGGSVLPDRFIPVLEDTALITTVGLWVLRTACSNAAGWRSRFGRDIRISVNLSARQLRDVDFADKVEQILTETGLPSHCLEVEITEHHLIEAKRTSDVLLRLEGLGVRLAIDDFGTGYSSLSYLKSFSIDVLKIDRSFIRDITQDEHDDAVTTAIIALAHKLGIEVIAEGVETREQLNFLREQDCDHIQGFYISRPVPADEFLVWYTKELSVELSRSWSRAKPA